MIKNLSELKDMNINKHINTYVAAFVTYLLLTRIVLYVYVTGDLFNTIISSIFACIGLLLAAIKVLKDYRFFKSKYMVLLFIFIIISAISSVLNIEYGYTSNLKMIIWMIIQFVVLFSVVNYSKEDFKDAILKMATTIIVVMFVCCLISLIQFLFNIHYTVDLPDYPRHQGFYDGRLFGIFDDPNFASVASISSIAFSFIISLSVKKNYHKYFHYFNILIQISYILLSNSRTGFVLLFICIILFGYYNAKYTKKGMKIMRFILIVTFSSLLIFILRESYAYLPNYIHITQNIKQKDMTYNTQEKTHISEDQSEDKFSNQDTKSNSDYNEINKNYLEREDEQYDLSNNRFDIWINAIKITKGHEIFGLSPRNMMCFAKTIDPNGYTAQTGYETHNGFLSIYVGTGIVGSFFMLLFILLCAIQITKDLFSKNIEAIYIGLLMIVCGFTFSTVMLQDVFFMNTATTIIFWRTLGLTIFIKEVDCEK